MNEEFLKFIEDTIEWLEELEDKCKTEEEWPKVGDHYWYVNGHGEVCSYEWNDDSFDITAFENNAIFKTKEEAEFEAERLKVLRELEKIARSFESGKANYLIQFDHLERELKVSGYSQRQGAYGDFYFKTAVEARQAIEEIGEERIKKYLFRVVD